MSILNECLRFSNHSFEMGLIFQMPADSAIIFSLKWNVQIFLESCCRYSGKYFLCCIHQITRNKDSKLRKQARFFPPTSYLWIQLTVKLVTAVGTFTLLVFSVMILSLRGPVLYLYTSIYLYFFYMSVQGRITVVFFLPVLLLLVLCVVFYGVAGFFYFLFLSNILLYHLILFSSKKVLENWFVSTK